MKTKKIGAGLYTVTIDGIEIWIENHTVTEGYTENYWSWNLPGNYANDAYPTKKEAILALQSAVKNQFIWSCVVNEARFFKS